MNFQQLHVRKIMQIIYILYEFKTPIKYLLLEDMIKKIRMVSAQCDLHPKAKYPFA